MNIACFPVCRCIVIAFTLCLAQIVTNSQTAKNPIAGEWRRAKISILCKKAFHSFAFPRDVDEITSPSTVTSCPAEARDREDGKKMTPVYTIPAFGSQHSGGGGDRESRGEGYFEKRTLCVQPSVSATTSRHFAGTERPLPGRDPDARPPSESRKGFAERFARVKMASRAVSLDLVARVTHL